MDFEQQQFCREKQKEYEKLDASKQPERAKKIIKFLDKINAFEFFKNLDNNKEKIDFENFKSLLIRLNGIARGISIKAREFDGKNVELSGLIETVLPPREEDKDEILKFALALSKDLDAKDNSYMLSAVINALHMFNDGNGRTSRIIYLLLNSKDKETFYSELERALGANGRFDSLDINPGLVNWEIEQEILNQHDWYFDPEKHNAIGHKKLKGRIVSTEYDQIDYSKKSFGENIKKYQKIASSDTHYLLTATVESLSDEQYNSILLKDKFISPLKMEVLSEQDWGKIFSTYYKLKKEGVKTLVRIFTDPEEYRNPYDEKETLKDLFIRKIKEEYETNNPTNN